MRWQITFLMSLATIVPTLALLTGGYWAFKAYLVPERVEFLTTLAREYDMRVTTHLNTRLEEITALAHELQDQEDLSNAPLTDELHDHPTFVALEIVGADGSVVASPGNTEGDDVHRYLGLLAFAEGYGAAIGRLTEDPAAGGLIVPIAVRVGTGEPVRMLLAKLLWSDVLSVMYDGDRIDSEGRLERFVIAADTDGRALLMSPAAMTFAAPLEPVAGLRPGASSTSRVGIRYRIARSSSTLDGKDPDSIETDSAGDPLWNHTVYLLEDERLALAPVRVAATIGAVVLGVAVVLGTALAGFWSGRLTRQLSLVVEATKRLAAGEAIEPIPIISENESGVLALKFNEMAGTLATARRTLEEHAASLEETNARLRELDETKNRLLANVSHELRTPVAAIVSAAKIIHKYHDKKPEAVERFSETILKEGRRLAHLVNEALDLAKVESVKVEWHDAELEPAMIVQEALEDLRKKAEAAKVSVVSIIDDGLPRVVADHDRLLQVLENVIDNAVKFTPEGGTVTVRAGNDDDGLLFEVSDTGVGIPEGDLERIFERFYQVQDADPSREKPVGSGLGLTISRNIVSRYGGRIWAESAPGRGTTVRFTIPRDGARRAAEREAFATGI